MFSEQIGSCWSKGYSEGGQLREDVRELHFTTVLPRDVQRKSKAMSGMHWGVISEVDVVSPLLLLSILIPPDVHSSSLAPPSTPNWLLSSAQLCVK